MRNIILRSSFVSLTAILLMYLFRIFLKTDLNIGDIGGVNNFLAIFGTLYGILTAFVVFEVWGQYNNTVKLIDNEASGLERMYRLILYFRDNKLAVKIKEVINKYIDLVVTEEFPKLSQNERSQKCSTVFRKFHEIIREIKFDDDHDSITFDHLLENYDQISTIRSERINQSLARLPGLLKIFLYLSSGFVVTIFLLMPFSNMYYGFLTVGILTFILGMVFQLIEDLDNPFVGYWNISPEAFERAKKHIEEDY